MIEIILMTLTPVTHRTAEENIGMGYIASSLREKGYKVKILDEWLEGKDINKKLDKIMKKENSLKILNFSTYMSNIKKTLEKIKVIKKENPNLIITCGGFGPTSNPEIFLNSGADYVIIGEGENTYYKLVDLIIKNKGNKKKLKNVCYLDSNQKIYRTEYAPLHSDLDTLLFPSRETMIYSIQRNSYVNMSTSRGCKGNCFFCSVITFFREFQGAAWRGRTITNIVNEIEVLYKKGVRFIKFVDDSFLEGERNWKWCKNFAAELKKRNINVYLRTAVRADKLDERSLYFLKKAGFISFSIGIENGAKSALQRMNKGASKQNNIEVLKNMKKYNIYIQAGFILFDYNTTMNELWENLSFLKKYNWMIMKGIFSEMYAAENTKYTAKLTKEKSLLNKKKVENQLYLIKEPSVYKVYSALKLWHTKNSELYDMTIDPLVSPKAISKKGLEMFYFEFLKLKKIDLVFFENVLQLVEKGLNESQLNNYVYKQLKFVSYSHKKIELKVKSLYNDFNLVYDADKNPFL